MERTIPARNSNETPRIPRVVRCRLARIPTSERASERAGTVRRGAARRGDESRARGLVEARGRRRRRSSEPLVDPTRRPSRSRHRAGVLLNQSGRSVGVIRAPTCRQVDSSPPLRTQKRMHRSGRRDRAAIGRLKNSHGDVTNVTRGARFSLVATSDQRELDVFNDG